MNIGTIEDPKFIKLGDTCLEEETLKYIKLFKEFYGVPLFSKTFAIIQPLKSLSTKLVKLIKLLVYYQELDLL